MSGGAAMQPARGRAKRAALAVAGLASLLGACRPAAPDTVAAQPAADAPAAVQARESATVAPNPGTPIETHWQCGERRVAARFDPASQTLTLIHERGQLALPQSVSASGARYADANGNEFWSQGNGATLTLSGTPARECQPVSAAGAAPG